MTVTLDTSALEAEFGELSREIAREAAGRWFTSASEYLLEGGDREEYDVFPVAQSALPPQWDPGEGGYVLAFPHVAARYFNDGTTEHEIRARRADFLAFEWPEAPPEIREAFEETFPTVFFKEVTADGITAIRYLERGQRDAQRWLESQ